jgi:hypothetical protein
MRRQAGNALGRCRTDWQAELARRILRGEVRDGQTVQVGYKDGELTFTPHSSPAPTGAR